MGIEQVFNSTLEFGDLINSMTINVTGAESITLLLLLAFLILVAIVFKVPEVLWMLALVPIVTVFATIDPSFWGILGIFAFVIGGGLFVLFRR